MRNLVRLAATNPRCVPFKGASIIDGTLVQRGSRIQGRRWPLVDVGARTLTIEERWGGVVTARRTERLGSSDGSRPDQAECTHRVLAAGATPSVENLLYAASAP